MFSGREKMEPEDREKMEPEDREKIEPEDTKPNSTIVYAKGQPRPYDCYFVFSPAHVDAPKGLTCVSFTIHPYSFHS
jgi:hypothetical protein